MYGSKQQQNESNGCLNLNVIDNIDKTSQVKKMNLYYPISDYIVCYRKEVNSF